MYGKLLGTAGVGLFMIAVWIGCGVFAAYATHGAISDLIRGARSAELVGNDHRDALLLRGRLFDRHPVLAIGAMSDSMRDRRAI